MTEKTETALVPRHHFFTELDPWRRSESVRTMVDRFFGDLSEGGPRRAIVSAPNVDITETVDEYLVHAELPGVSKNDVSVELEQGLLSIRGEKKNRRDEKGEQGRVLECSYGAFCRSFALPQDADPDQITAEFKEGVLEIAIHKNPEGKPKQIAIKG